MAPIPTHNRYAVLADQIVGELATPDRNIVRSADSAKKRRNHCVREWLVDTGASYDMVDSNVMFNRKDVIRDSSGPVLKTAAGAKRAQQRANLTLPEMGEKISAIVLPGAPPALSVGARCQHLGYWFVWEPYSDQPYFVTPERLRIGCSVRNQVPYVSVNNNPERLDVGHGGCVVCGGGIEVWSFLMCFARCRRSYCVRTAERRCP